MVDHRVVAGECDDLTEEDYKDMLAELRGKFTFAQLAEICGLRFSGAYWSKVERGQAPFSREVREELRRVHGLLPLRQTAQDAVAGVPANATVLHIAHDDPGEVNRLVLVGGNDDLSIFCNGDGAGLRLSPEGRVTEVIRAQEHGDGHTALDCTHCGSTSVLGRPGAFVGRPVRQRRLVRPVAAPSQEARRSALGVAWKSVIDAGLAALEAERKAS